MTTSPLPFHELLRRAVDDHAFRTGKKKRAIAAASGYSASMLSHMTSGKRLPGSRMAVVALGNALELGTAKANELLRSLDYTPLTEAEAASELIGSRVSELSAEALPFRERELLSQMVNQDLQTLGNAWRRYVDLRDELQRRNWQEVVAGAERGRLDYKELLSAASRYAGWLELVDAEAMQYQERLDDAKAACRRGLAAADASRTAPLRAILTAKLADIEKLQGEFWSSDNHYQSALQTLREWHPESAVQRRFAEHWDARIQREQGNLLLFMARPTEAVALLEQSLAYFQREHEIYEEARVSHSLGWAAHLMGDWDRSMAWRLRSIELADLLEAERGWRDPLLSLQGNLYLGLLLEDQGNYAEAEHYLIHALELTRGGQSNQFHEVGLVQIALSRIYRADWSQRDLAQSEWFAEQGLQFYESMLTKDPMRLAIAHNAYSDLLVEKRRFHEALLEAEQAIQWAQSSTPPNPYYEAAGHLRCARAILLDLRGRSSIDSAPLQLSLGSNRASASSSSVQQARRELDEERVEAELEEAARLARTHNLRQTSAQTAAIQALLSLIRRDTAAVETCCWEAIWSALHVNRHILQQTWRSLEALPLTSQNRARLLKILYEKTNDALGEIRSLSNGSAMAETLLSLLRDAASQNSSGGGKK